MGQQKWGGEGNPLVKGDKGEEEDGRGRGEKDRVEGQQVGEGVGGESSGYYVCCLGQS